MILSLFLLIILSYKSSYQCRVEYLNNYHLTIFDDKAVSDFRLSTYEGIEKLWMCTLKCRDDQQCRSYQFNSIIRTCSLFGVGFNQTGLPLNVTMETGSRLYLMYGRFQSFGIQCLYIANCSYNNSVCSQGSCQCAVGYSYQSSTSSCEIRCNDYGNTVGLYLDHGVGSFNVKVLSLSTDTACMKACRTETAIVCINAEYELSTSKCNLCDSAWFDLPEANRLTDDYGWIVYYRHCFV